MCGTCASKSAIAKGLSNPNKHYFFHAPLRSSTEIVTVTLALDPRTTIAPITVRWYLGDRLFSDHYFCFKWLSRRSRTSASKRTRKSRCITEQSRDSNTYLFSAFLNGRTILRCIQGGPEITKKRTLICERGLVVNNV